MTLVATFEGRMGSGKTMGITIFAYFDYIRGKRILSNYVLKFPWVFITPKGNIYVEKMICPRCGNPWSENKDYLGYCETCKKKSAPVVGYYERFDGHILKKLPFGSRRLPKPSYFTWEYLIEHFDELQGVTSLTNVDLLLDEAYIYFDARNSSSKVNKMFTWFTNQTRKRSCDLYIACISFEDIDKRLRKATTTRNLVRFNKNTKWINIRTISQVTGDKTKMRFYAPDYWSLYDTLEIVPFVEGQKPLKEILESGTH